MNDASIIRLIALDQAVRLVEYARGTGYAAAHILADAEKFAAFLSGE